MEENQQVGAGSLMVGDLTFSTGEIFVKTVSDRINSDIYIKLIKNTAIPLMRDILSDGFVLQQDNCSIHVSKKSLNFVRRRELSFYLGPAEARSSKL